LAERTKRPTWAYIGPIHARLTVLAERAKRPTLAYIGLIRVRLIVLAEIAEAYLGLYRPDTCKTV
jgi:hypothetical protein